MPARPGRPRSFCPIGLSLDVFGDAWTLLIFRDLMFGGKRRFREFLESDEQISSNILADRLKMLVDEGLLTKADDPTHKQKAIYSLTARSIDLLPIIAQIGAWGRRHRRESDNLSEADKAFLRKLHGGGPKLWTRLMEKLRETHLASAKVTRRRAKTRAE
jgi:DNA-binding HxlR family transcriptional regulator